jgi:hypothetical protein
MRAREEKLLQQLQALDIGQRDEQAALYADLAEAVAREVGGGPFAPGGLPGSSNGAAAMRVSPRGVVARRCCSRGASPLHRARARRHCPQDPAKQAAYLRKAYELRLHGVADAIQQGGCRRERPFGQQRLKSRRRGTHTVRAARLCLCRPPSAALMLLLLR